MPELRRVSVPAVSSVDCCQALNSLCPFLQPVPSICLYIHLRSAPWMFMKWASAASLWLCPLWFVCAVNVTLGGEGHACRQNAGVCRSSPGIVSKVVSSRTDSRARRPSRVLNMAQNQFTKETADYLYERYCDV